MRITLKEWLAQHGYSSADEALAEHSEPDGHCANGAPSLLLALGVI